MSCGWLCSVGIAIIAVAPIVVTPCAAQQLTNDKLSLTLNAKDGAYQLAVRGGQPIFTSGVAAQVNHQWLRSADYPRHQVSESTFSDELGAGRAITVTNSGLPGKADLIYVVQLYEQNSYATLQVTVRNSTDKEVTVQAIRGLEALGEPLLNLGGPASADRILSDSFSEDWPQLRLYDLGKAPDRMHRGVGSQIVYNRESKESLFIGALTADRLLTVLHLQAAGEGAGTRIASYSVEFTGTTEIQKAFDMSDALPENLVELS